MSNYEFISRMWIYMVDKGHFDSLYFASKNFDDVSESHRYRNEGYTPEEAAQQWMDDSA